MGSYTDEVAHDNAIAARGAPNLASFTVGVAAPRDLFRVLVGDPASAWVPERTVADLVTNATTTVTSATASFTAADVGKRVTGKNIPTAATIASVTNGTTAVLSIAATGSGTNRGKIGGALSEVSGTMPAGGRGGELLIASGVTLTQQVADIIGV
jgi:hypothetical protein